MGAQVRVINSCVRKVCAPHAPKNNVHKGCAQAYLEIFRLSVYEVLVIHSAATW